MVLFVKRVGVLGGGVMGSQIADIMALNGKEVIIRDISEELVNNSYSQIEKNLNDLVTFHLERADKEITRIEKTDGIKLTDDQKSTIKEIRLNHLLDEQEREEIDPETKQEWMNKWRDEIEKGRQQLEDYMKGARDEDSFPPEARPFDEMETRKKRKKKVNPLSRMKNIDWNPYDETLKANMKCDWRLDQPPPEEN